ncbi:MAG: YfhO family protein [Vicinamibacterales bacterium]
MPHLNASLARVAPPALIVTLALTGLGSMIWHPAGLFNRHSDLLATHLSTQTILYQSWQNGHGFPLWRSDILSGQPALTNPQALYTHPIHILFALVAPERVVGLIVWLHVVIGAVGTYYAGAALQLSGPARLMVAVSVLFSFKTILMVYAGNLGVIIGISTLPFLFGATASVIERRSSHSALALGGAGALSLHSGHLQVTYYAALFIAAWGIFRISQLIFRGERAGAWKLGRLLALGGLIAIALSAYLLLPIATDVGLSTRTAASYEFFLARTPAFGVHLLTIFNPELFGAPLDGSFVEAWEYIAFVGGVTSLFAFAGAVHGRQRPLVGVLLAGLGASVLLSFHTPLLRFLFEVVPGYSMFRLPARMLFLSAFFACCLAGIGLDRTLSTIANPVTRRRVVVLAIGLVALEGTFWARRYLVTPEPLLPVTRADYQNILRGVSSPARVAPLSYSTPDYGSAAALGWQLTTGYDPFGMRHYQTYIDLAQFNRALGPRPGVWTDLNEVGRPDMLAALNVLYVVSPKPLELPASEYTLFASFDSQPQFRFYQGRTMGPVYVYKNHRFVPRAFFVSNVIAAADESGVVKAVQQSDLRETAVVAAPAAGGKSTPTTRDRVEIVDSSAGSLDVTARNDEPRFLLVSEVWHPGWSARVDGQAATLFRTDVALLGLWLQPGDHRVELRFWPPGLTPGLVVTGLTIVGVISLLMTLAIRRPSIRGRAL